MHAVVARCFAAMCHTWHSAVPRVACCLAQPALLRCAPPLFDHSTPHLQVLDDSTLIQEEQNLVIKRTFAQAAQEPATALPSSTAGTDQAGNVQQVHGSAWHNGSISCSGVICAAQPSRHSKALPGMA